MNPDVTTSHRFCDRTELSEVLGIQLVSPSDNESSDVEDVEVFNVDDYVFDDAKAKAEFRASMTPVPSGMSTPIGSALSHAKTDTPTTSANDSGSSGPSTSGTGKKPTTTPPADDQSAPDIDSPFSAIVEKTGWPQPALLRLLHLVTVHDLCVEPGAEDLFYSFLANKVRWIYSDEPIISLAYVHEDDVDKVVRSIQVDEEPFYVRPNYDFKPTADMVREAVQLFFDTKYIKSHSEPIDNSLGNFQFRKPRNQKPTQQASGSSQLTRSRRTGRANPLVEAIVEEKKNYKRNSLA
uniref:Uncharacterized protein n=1 Tax=Panagrellus redivivus TaxID=6233 RepID=A0A7E4UTT5_PANRE